MGLVSRIIQAYRALESRLLECSDQFVLLRYLAIVFAIRYDAAGKRIRQALWYLYRLMYLAVYASYWYKLYWKLAHWTNALSAVNLLSVIWIYTGALLRVILIDRAVLGQLQRFLNDHSFRERDPEVQTVRFRMKRRNIRFMLVTMGALVVEVAIYMGTNLREQTDFMLQYRGQIVGGRLVNEVLGLISTFGGILYVVVFDIVYTTINAFRVEMAILKDSFSHVGVMMSRNRTRVSMGSMRDDQFWRELQEQFKCCVQRHAELLRQITEFRWILGPFSFIQYYGSFVLIGSYSFVVISEGFTGIVITYIGFALLLVLESFLLCQSVGALNELHTSIGRTLYEFEWPNHLRQTVRHASAYRHTRLNFLIVMIRTQRDLPVTIDGLKTIGMNRFADLLNNSYTLLTLLMQLKGPT
ncbi:uncharacterized protein LOC118463890 [Anopheles albimanus]|uniref:uncharacterized protein LOC118463890 n=1 Tax=Anopheles albimanus TaxID=7167 RepID=UPI00163F12CF|nr:uncharacterized protein LOC118463890 [Anopheles albimanus]